jgi:hypothetical protein
MTKAVTKEVFEARLLKIIDEKLNDLFGEMAASVIYSYLERRFSLKREDIPQNLGMFTEGLNEFLSSGALVIETIILRDLYSSFGLKFTQITKNRGFVDYVNELKSKIKKMLSQKSRKIRT